jgi:hypothetical protein
VIAALLLSGVGAVYLRQGPREVTVDDAVAAFRSSSSSSSTTATDGSTAPTGTPVAGAAPEPTPASADAGRPATPTTSSATSAAAPPPSSGRTATAASAPPAPASPSPAPAPPPAPQLEEGVYTFTTEGYEATNALGGARHDYPRETPVTLRRTECGWTQRWQPLAERWDESLLCPSGDDVDVRRFTTFHEFFQRSQQQQFDCPPGSAVVRRGAPAGATWSWRCTAGASAIDTVVTIVGPEPVVVEGQEVPAVRVHYESTMTGANRGTQKQDRWIRDDGMNLRIQTDIDTEADSPFGAVHYEEHYVITIASLRPRR